VISSGALGQTTVPMVHDEPQVNTIYIFCGNKGYHEKCAKEWPKVAGVYTDITPILRVRVDEMSLNRFFGPKLHIWLRVHVLQTPPLMIFRL
jgi:hypothetical protein